MGTHDEVNARALFRVQPGAYLIVWCLGPGIAGSVMLLEAEIYRILRLTDIETVPIPNLSGIG